MKKKVFVVFALSILLLSFIALAELEKTRVYGMLDPNSKLKLYLTYRANGVNSEDQLVTKETDAIGLWEYKISSDPGEINIRVSYKNEEKTFTIQSGSDFEVNLRENETRQTGQTNESIITENTTQETTGNITAQTTETQITTETTAEKTEETEPASKTTGSAIKISEFLPSKSSYYIIGFIAVVLAIAFIFGIRMYANRAPSPIKTVLLSKKAEEFKSGKIFIKNTDLIAAQKKIREAQEEINRIIDKEAKLKEARAKYKEARKNLDDLER